MMEYFSLTLEINNFYISEISMSDFLDKRSRDPIKDNPQSSIRVNSSDKLYNIQNDIASFIQCLKACQNCIKVPSQQLWQNDQYLITKLHEQFQKKQIKFITKLCSQLKNFVKSLIISFISQNNRTSQNLLKQKKRLQLEYENYLNKSQIDKDNLIENISKHQLLIDSYKKSLALKQYQQLSLKQEITTLKLHRTRQQQVNPTSNKIYTQDHINLKSQITEYKQSHITLNKKLQQHQKQILGLKTTQQSLKKELLKQQHDFSKKKLKLEELQTDLQLLKLQNKKYKEQNNNFHKLIEKYDEKFNCQLTFIENVSKMIHKRQQISIQCQRFREQYPNCILVDVMLQISIERNELYQKLIKLQSSQKQIILVLKKIINSIYSKQLLENIHFANHLESSSQPILLLDKLIIALKKYGLMNSQLKITGFHQNHERQYNIELEDRQIKNDLLSVIQCIKTCEKQVIQSNQRIWKNPQYLKEVLQSICARKEIKHFEILIKQFGPFLSLLITQMMSRQAKINEDIDRFMQQRNIQHQLIFQDFQIDRQNLVESVSQNQLLINNLKQIIQYAENKQNTLKQQNLHLKKLIDNINEKQRSLSTEFQQQLQKKDLEVKKVSIMLTNQFAEKQKLKEQLSQLRLLFREKPSKQVNQKQFDKSNQFFQRYQIIEKKIMNVVQMTQLGRFVKYQQVDEFIKLMLENYDSLLVDRENIIQQINELRQNMNQMNVQNQLTFEQQTHTINNSQLHNQVLLLRAKLNQKISDIQAKTKNLQSINDELRHLENQQKQQQLAFTQKQHQYQATIENIKKQSFAKLSVQLQLRNKLQSQLRQTKYKLQSQQNRNKQLNQQLEGFYSALTQPEYMRQQLQSLKNSNRQRQNQILQYASKVNTLQIKLNEKNKLCQQLGKKDNSGDNNVRNSLIKNEQMKSKIIDIQLTNAKQKLNERQNQLKELQQEISKLQIFVIQKDKLAHEITKLNQQIKNYQSENNKQKKQMHQYQLNYDNLMQQNKTLQIKYSNQEQQIAQLYQKVNKYQHELAYLNKQKQRNMQNHKIQIQSLKSAQSKYKNTISKYKYDIQNYQKQIQILKEQINEKSINMQYRENTYIKQKQYYQEKIENFQRSFKQEHNVWNQKQKQYQFQNQMLASNLKQTIETCDNKQIVFKRERSNLQQIVDNYQHQIKVLEASLQNIINRSKSDIQNCQRQMQTVQKQLNQKIKILQIRQQSNIQQKQYLQTKIHENNNNYNLYQQQSILKQRQYEVMMQSMKKQNFIKISTQIQAKNKCQSENNQLKYRLENEQKRNKDLLDEIEKLYATVAEKDNIKMQNQNLKEFCKQKDQYLKQFQNNLNILERKLNEKNNLSQQLNRKDLQNNNKIKALLHNEQNIQNLQDQILMLNTKLKEKQLSKKSLEQQLSTIKHQILEKDRIVSQLNRLKQNIKHIQLDNQKNLKNIHQLELKNQHLVKQNQMIRGKYNNLQLEYKNLGDKFNKYQYQVLHLTKQKQRKLSNLTLELQDLKQFEIKSKSIITKYKFEINQLQKQLQNRKQKLLETTMNIQYLQKTNKKQKQFLQQKIQTIEKHYQHQQHINTQKQKQFENIVESIKRQNAIEVQFFNRKIEEDKNQFLRMKKMYENEGIGKMKRQYQDMGRIKLQNLELNSDNKKKLIENIELKDNIIKRLKSELQQMKSKNIHYEQIIVNQPRIKTQSNENDNIELQRRLLSADETVIALQKKNKELVRQKNGFLDRIQKLQYELQQSNNQIYELKASLSDFRIQKQPYHQQTTPVFNKKSQTELKRIVNMISHQNNDMYDPTLESYNQQTSLLIKMCNNTQQLIDKKRKLQKKLKMYEKSQKYRQTDWIDDISKSINNLVKYLIQNSFIQSQQHRRMFVFQFSPSQLEINGAISPISSCQSFPQYFQYFFKRLFEVIHEEITKEISGPYNEKIGELRFLLDLFLQRGDQNALWQLKRKISKR